MNNNNHKFLSRWFRRGLLIIAAQCVMNDSIAAQTTKEMSHISSKELLLKIKERDAVIADLLLRVQTLENNRNGAVTRQKSPVYDSQSPPAQAAEAGAQTAKAGGQTKTAETEAAPPQSAGAGAQEAKAGSQTKTAETEAPGEFKVDEQAAQRALERTLAKTGVLLLPSGYLDTDLNFTFTHREDQNLVGFNTQNNSTIAIVGAGKLRRNLFAPSLAFRLGLPFETQLEFSLPYQFINQSNNAPPNNIKENGSALGDVRIGLAKTLLREDKWWPDLIARVTWNTGSGTASTDNIATGAGFESVTGGFSALKRQDPLAFFLSVDYTTSFTKKNFNFGANGFTSSSNPGDNVGISFGTQLAASADTSLSFALQQLFINNSALDSKTIAGSDRSIALLSIGASSIISRSFFVNLSVGIGLTNDAPDYTTGITISNRTNLKPYLKPYLGLD